MVYLYNRELKREDFDTTEAHYRQGTRSDWQEHYGDFQTAAFQPIDNLATYWFEQFRAAPSLQTIGYALHATGDVAQPHHVWITSANGHSSWEGWVDDHYASEKLNDPAAVANLVGRYDPSKSIRDLLTQTGQVAYARPEPLYDTSYETRLRVAKELIPESIAPDRHRTDQGRQQLRCTDCSLIAPGAGVAHCAGSSSGLLACSAHGVPAKAPQDLRIDGEVLPGRSIDLLEQALSRVKFNTDPQQLRRGLVENRLLARAVEDQLTAQSRADLDASVEIEAGNLLEQVYGRRYREDLGPYLRQPRALSAERLREVLAPRNRGLVENSLLLDETQRREAAGVELIGWQFPGQPAQVLDLLSLYEGDNVQGQVELQQGNLAYLARQVQTRIRRDYLWYRLAQDGFGPAERQGREDPGAGQAGAPSLSAPDRPLQ